MSISLSMFIAFIEDSKKTTDHIEPVVFSLMIRMRIYLAYTLSKSISKHLRPIDPSIFRQYLTNTNMSAFLIKNICTMPV